MAEQVDYKAVLADLTAKRDRLNAAIAGIEQVLGIAAGTPEGAATGTAEGGVDEIRADTFFGLSVPQAALKFLGMTGRKPKSPYAIAEGLRAGGQEQASYNNVYTALKRLRASRAVVKLPNGDWGLSEWYPGGAGRKPTRPRGNGEELVAEAAAEQVEGDESGEGEEP